MAFIRKNSAELMQLNEYLKYSKHPVIIPHENPDGDAIGSALAVYHILRLSHVNPVVISPNNFPDFLKWMPGADRIIIANRRLNKAKELIAKADLIIYVDFNEISRMAELAPILQQSNAPVILFDHHPNPAGTYSLVFHSTEASSTAELIFETFEKAGFSGKMNIEAAECLYAGIMTDTGSFNFNSSNASTFRVVSKLLKAGINKDDIFDKVYNNFSASRMRLLGYALNEKMTVLPLYKTAFISLSMKDLADYNYVVGDTEGFVNYPLSVAGVRVSAIFIERPDHIKISFRSKGSFPVNRFASAYFNGGGHLNAAGGEYKGSLAEAIELFVKHISLQQDEIK